MYNQLKDGLFNAFLLIGADDLSYKLAEQIKAFNDFSWNEIECLCNFVDHFVAKTPEVNSIVKPYIKQLVKALY
ncbi:MAG: hypothetical protein WC307_03610 [Candidatus Nanoarchaeia archaeon]|jgi:hypothetical protein